MGIVIFRDYGWVIFTALPIYQGFAAAMLLAWCRPQAPLRIGAAAILTLVFVGFWILLLALDGAVCIWMALPLAIPLSILGAALGSLVMSRLRLRSGMVKTLPLLLTAGSLFGGVVAEAACNLPTPESTVVTTVEIAAPPQVVWQHVPNVPTIVAAPALLFRLGFACPLSSQTSGEGVGAKRICLLSTGSMVERVTRWEADRCLRFDVLATPPAMVESSIYPALHPAHLESGCYQSDWGEFTLVPTDHGTTRLIGTSHYHNRIWPPQYWLPISDYIVHSVHRRVFAEIKRQSEADVRDGSVASRNTPSPPLKVVSSPAR